MKQNDPHFTDFLTKIQSINNNPVDKEIEKDVAQLVKDFKGLKGVAQDQKVLFQEEIDKFYQSFRQEKADKSWEKWSNTNQLKKLSNLVEGFVSRSDLTGLAEEVFQAIEEWKKVGPRIGDQSQELWKVFKEGCDVALNKCLDKKTKILAELETIIKPILELTDEEIQRGEKISISKVSEQVKALQKSWNGIGVLPAKMEKNIRKEFTKLCNDFFKKIKPFYEGLDKKREDNLVLKKQLVAQAQKLTKNSKDDFETAKKLKELQANWKSIGPTPKKVGDEIWKQFQLACNSHFEKLDTLRQENSKAKTEIFDKVLGLEEQLKESESIKKFIQEYENYLNEWKSVGPGLMKVDKDQWNKMLGLKKGMLNQKEKQKSEKDQQMAEIERDKVVHLDKIRGLLHDQASNIGEELDSIIENWKNLPAGRGQWESICKDYLNGLKDLLDSEDASEVTDSEKELSKKAELLVMYAVIARLIDTSAELPSIPPAYMASQIKFGQKYKGMGIGKGSLGGQLNVIQEEIKSIRKSWIKGKKMSSTEYKEIWLDFLFYHDFLFRRILASKAHRR